MTRRCTPTTARSIALAIDRAFGPVEGDAPYVYLAQPGGLLMEVAIEEPYEFLAELVPPPPTIAIGLLVEGWAAPWGAVSDGLRPSEHPERQRVRTTMVVGRGGEYSVVRYAGNEEPIPIGGPIDGDLAIAMRHCWARAMAQAR